MSQAIAFAELENPQHGALLEDSVTQSAQLNVLFPGVSQDELAVEIAVRLLQSFIMAVSDTHAVDDKIVASGRPAYHWHGPHADQSTLCIRH